MYCTPLRQVVYADDVLMTSCSIFIFSFERSATLTVWRQTPLSGDGPLQRWTKVCTGLHLWIEKWFDVFLADYSKFRVIWWIWCVVSPSVSVSACEPHRRWPRWRLEEESIQIKHQCFWCIRVMKGWIFGPVRETSDDPCALDLKS